MNLPRSWTRYATPRDLTRPSRGDVTLAHLTRLTRRVPYVWQWDVAQVAGELNEDLDGFRYSIVVLAVPRRAGKSTLNLAANLDHLDVGPMMRGWYTCANGREVAAKLFRDEWDPLLAPIGRVYKIRKSQGSEGIHKRAGRSSLQLFAPTPTALHSTNVDTATVDEAFAADMVQGEGIESGIRPAQLTRPWRQTWIVSAGGTIASTWLDHWLTAGERQLPGVALFDMGADPTAPDYDPADPRVWARSHPTCGEAFPLATLEQEWALRTDTAAFERAYLNVWPRPSTVLANAGLDLDRWRSAASPQTAPERVLAIALDVAADRTAATVAVAGAAGDRTVVEVVDARAGTGWVAGVVKDLRSVHRGVPVVADSLVAALVVADLERAGVTVDAIGATDHARACGAFVDQLATGRLVHRAQAVLDDAVIGAARRPLGDAWLWSRSRSTIDISPLVAVTLAAWTSATTRPRGRPAVVVSETPAPSTHPGGRSPVRSQRGGRF